MTRNKVYKRGFSQEMLNFFLDSYMVNELINTENEFTDPNLFINYGVIRERCNENFSTIPYIFTKEPYIWTEINANNIEGKVVLTIHLSFESFFKKAKKAKFDIGYYVKFVKESIIYEMFRVRQYNYIFKKGGVEAIWKMINLFTQANNILEKNCKNYIINKIIDFSDLDIFL